MSQVKKGFKGFFSRKKGGQQSQPQDAQSAVQDPSNTNAAAGPGAATTSSTQSGAPQLAVPTNVQEAKDIDLKPDAAGTSTTTGPAPPNTASALADSHKVVGDAGGGTEQEGASANNLRAEGQETKSKTADGVEGMSATSGPLGDPHDHFPGDGAPGNGVAGAEESKGGGQSAAERDEDIGNVESKGTDADAAKEKEGDVSEEAKASKASASKYFDDDGNPLQGANETAGEKAVQESSGEGGAEGEKVDQAEGEAEGKGD